MQETNEVVMHGKYRVTRKIAGGVHGEIFEGIDIKTGQELAIKLEPLSSKQKYLEKEFKIFFQLQGEPGIPIIHWYGKQGESYVLVMELLGPPLEYLFTNCKRKFTLKTVLLVADQVLQRLQLLHSKLFIHRDIKPENIMVGRGKTQHTFYLIDLTIAAQFLDPSTGEHLPTSPSGKMQATPRYTSVNTHAGMEQSRRDDMESFGYVMVYFLKGALPWQSLSAKSFEEQLDRIRECKAGMSPEEICEGLPQEFAVYLKYCRQLRFDEAPDYEYLRTLFRNLFNRSGLKRDTLYDWIKQKPVIKMGMKKEGKAGRVPESEEKKEEEEAKAVIPIIAPVHPDAIKEASEEDSPASLKQLI